jgi:hypothetical protein
MNETDLMAGSPGADSTGCEPYTAFFEPFYRCRQIVDPEPDMVQRWLVDSWPTIGIDWLHEVDLDGMCPLADREHVLVHVVVLVVVVAALDETEQVDPQLA